VVEVPFVAVFVSDQGSTMSAADVNVSSGAIMD
jgi:hypothetical protein